ncbi:MAG: amino acid permease [Novosphingobium sp.]|nr:amino acid permease [Novosphingobium sp.]
MLKFDLRRKDATALTHPGETGLSRSLGLGSLVMLGVGTTVGAGIYVLTGIAAAHHAGPAVALAFVVAGVACLFAGLCYAELAGMFPVSGSAYSYAFVAFGEALAWAVGWTLVLEYLFTVAVLAAGWSGYFTALLRGNGLTLPPQLTRAPLAATPEGLVPSGAVLDLPALGIVLATTALLTGRLEHMARLNNLLVVLKISVIIAFVAFGATHLDPANLDPFVPANEGRFGHFGWTGVLQASGLLFYAYIGFDGVSATALEARRPQRDVPLAILLSLVVCGALYVLTALVLTGLVPYRELDVPDPLLLAIERAGPALAWLRPWIGGSIVLGLVATILSALYGQTRIFFVMARDGLLPAAFARASSAGVPAENALIVGLLSAVMACTLPIDALGELSSIGTLFAFLMVCLAMIALRLEMPEAHRPFRAPFGIVTGVLGAAFCLVLMASMPGATWIRLLIWLALGAAIYLFYGRKRSHLAASRENSA